MHAAPARCMHTVQLHRMCPEECHDEDLSEDAFSKQVLSRATPWTRCLVSVPLAGCSWTHQLNTMPLQECQDEDLVEDGFGKQELFRTVRIPFRVAVVTGNLKLRMHVTQSRLDGLVSIAQL